MDDKKRRDTEEQEAEETAGEILEGDIDNERTDTKEVESLRNEAAKWEDSYKRALADYQNLQRRTLDEKREWARLSNKEFILKILPILDTLVLA
ncbi:MAG TPA: nucleotide exchange factor GrpE, partial [Candidatus Saccharimonadales bacterium]|nr:nucleotide exchange factor GrpE [Candidatus Saccharimonadales bacterium]